MARIKYRNIDFGTERAKRIVQINKILQEYTTGVSVRQVYYRLVAASLIDNVKSEYDKIQTLITDARYAGLIDWDAIEDRGRAAERREHWATAKKALDEVIEDFRLDRWKDQPYYVELWVEKDALAGVLGPISNDYHVPLLSTRGYNSATAMKDAADRILRATRAQKHVVIAYVGDFDPSGLHMVTNARERLLEFGCSEGIVIRRVAITREQIDEHRPPPNPLKRKDDPELYKVADGSFADARAEGFVARHGETSYEADALPPKVLDFEVRKVISSYIDKPKMTAAIKRENLIKKGIADFTKSFREPGV